MTEQLIKDLGFEKQVVIPQNEYLELLELSLEIKTSEEGNSLKEVISAKLQSLSKGLNANVRSLEEVGKMCYYISKYIKLKEVM